MQNRKKNLTNKAGEVRELLTDDFASAVTFDALPADLQQGLASLKKRGRPKVDNPKRVKSFKLSGDVIDAIEQSGKGYNRRVDELLRSALNNGLI